MDLTLLTLRKLLPDFHINVDYPSRTTTTVGKAHVILLGGKNPVLTL